MENRIFKHTDANDGSESIYVIPTSEINTKYNCYGYYRKTDTVSVEDFQKIGSRYKIDIDDFRNISDDQLESIGLIIPKFNSEQRVLIISEFQLNSIIEILNFDIINDEYCWKDANDDIYIYENGGFEKNKASDFTADTYEFEDYYDGHNWVEKIFSADHFETEFKEITNELTSEFENNLIQIHHKPDSQGISYTYSYNKENKKFYTLTSSRWQDSWRDYYTEISQSEAEIILAEYVSSDILNEYFPEFIYKFV